MNPALRADFPLLERTLDGRPLVYLDSAATALKPRAVLAAEEAYATQMTANVHRGKHALSEEASVAYESARKRIARFFNADPECLVFVKNTTEAINLVAVGLCLSSDDVVLNAGGEHHANLVPWMRRARVELVPGDPCEPVSLDAAMAAIARHRPKVLAIGHASNITGVIQPARALCEMARAHGVITVVDAAQSAPHLPIDVEEMGCDFLALSAHKMLGPTGVGALVGRREVLEALEPLCVGGGVVERVTATGYTLKKIPYRFEAGTPPISAALGFAAAVSYLDELGFDDIVEHERRLAAALSQSLCEIPGVEVLMARREPRLAIAAIAPRSALVGPDALARLLSDGHQIMVRSGFHCAHPLFDRLGLEHGALRASAYVYNTVEEVQRFGEVLRDLASRMVV
ncbi:cysteine desulfurase [Sorangium sp. So ce296]|uniref:aminotransferase class V-fold PLP-dependent enzyme n=1 Tax=Sorangium sp. So ce296 TaxID=3133296 RepID=UPI003F632128